MTCCARQSITNLDHTSPLFQSMGAHESITNRVCINCYTHWYGSGLSVKRYSRQEWDALVSNREAWEKDMAA